MAIPASVNRSNIHFSASLGRPGKVGAYQTHGVALASAAALAGMTKAGRSDERQAKLPTATIIFPG